MERPADSGDIETDIPVYLAECQKEGTTALQMH
jgi:hypothetical protein